MAKQTSKAKPKGTPKGASNGKVKPAPEVEPNQADDMYTGFVKVANSKLGNELTDAPIHHWLSTGCSLLDWAIKYGIPGGRVVEIFGREQSGKTALAMSIVRSAQMAGGMGIWLDAEGGFSEELAQDIVGVDLQNGWIYRRPFTGEETLDAIEAFCDYAVKARSNLPVVIVVDSVAGMCAASQTEGDFVDTARVTGKQASLMSWFFSRPTVKRILGTNVFLIFLNQTRTTLKFNNYGPPPEDTTPGGRALGFYATVRIEMSRLKFEEDESKLKHKTGHILRAYVKKNKCGIGYREVHFPFYFRPDQPVCGIDDPMAILTYLITRGVIEQKSGGWYIFDGQQKRKKEWRDLMLRDETAYMAMREAALQTFLKEHGVGSLEEIPNPGRLTPELADLGE